MTGLDESKRCLDAGFTAGMIDVSSSKTESGYKWVLQLNATPTSISRSVALTAFASLADRWGVHKTKRHELLGVPARTVKSWFSNLRGTRKKHEKPLDSTTLQRISHLLAIYDGLHRMLDPIAADAWIRNENEAFGGSTPLMLLTNGRFEEIIVVRRYVDRMLYR